MGSPKVEALREEVDSIKAVLEDFQSLVESHHKSHYDAMYGMFTKIDLLQDILLQIIRELPDDVKTKVLNPKNLEQSAYIVKENLQKRIDKFLIAPKPIRREAALRQMEEDIGRTHAP